MKGNFKFTNLVLILFLSFLCSSCLTNVEEQLDDTPIIADPCESITYILSVQPIISNNCTQCHSTNGGQSPNLDSYNGLSANASRVLNEVVSRRMPRGGNLTTEEIATIKCWVDNGALNN